MDIRLSEQIADRIECSSGVSLCEHITCVLRASACIIVSRSQLCASRVVASFGLAPEVSSLLCESLVDKDWRRLEHGAFLSGSMCGPSLLTSIDDWCEQRLHHEFRFALSERIQSKVGAELYVLVLRGAGEPNFDKRDAWTLRNLGRMIASLDLLPTHGADYEQASNDFSLYNTVLKTLDQLTVGIVLLDESRAITTMNRTAKEIFGAAGQKGQDTLLQHIMDLRGKSEAKKTEPLSPTIVTIAGKDDSMTLLLADTILSAGQHTQRRLRHPMSAVFLSNIDQPFRGYEEWLQRLYRLTRLEARMVTLLVEGDSPTEIAGKLNLSIHTIRAYLKHIFMKTEVSRQSDLVRLLLRGLGQVRVAQDAVVLPEAKSPG